MTETTPVKISNNLIIIIFIIILNIKQNMARHVSQKILEMTQLV